MTDISRLQVQLQVTKLQNKDNPLYQLLHEMIGALKDTSDDVKTITSGSSSGGGSTTNNITNNNYAMQSGSGVGSGSGGLSATSMNLVVNNNSAINNIINNMQLLSGIGSGLGGLHATFIPMFSLSSGGINGSGTIGKIPKWTGISALGDSILSEIIGVLHLSGVPFAANITNYNRLLEPAGNYAIFLGNAVDPTNYYDNTAHVFRGRGGSGATSISVIGIPDVNGLTLEAVTTGRPMLKFRNATTGVLANIYAFNDRSIGIYPNDLFALAAYPSGGVVIGVDTGDPGAGALRVSGTVQWGGGIAISSSSNIALLNAANVFSNAVNTFAATTLTFSGAGMLMNWPHATGPALDFNGTMQWRKQSTAALLMSLTDVGLLSVLSEIVIGTTRKWFSSEASATSWWTNATGGTGSGIAANALNIYLRAANTTPAFATATQFTSNVEFKIKHETAARIIFEDETDGAAGQIGPSPHIISGGTVDALGLIGFAGIEFSGNAGTTKHMILSSAGLLTIFSNGIHAFGTTGVGTASTGLIIQSQRSANSGGSYLQIQGDITTGYLGGRSAIIGDSTFNDSMVLFGSTADGIDIRAGNASGAIRFAAGGSATRFAINTAGDWLKGSSIMDSVGTPTIASGFGASPSIVGNDYAFTITPTSGMAGGSGVINFGRTFNSAPSCSVSGGAFSVAGTLDIATTTTQATIAFSGTTGGSTKIHVLCRGY